MSDMLRVAQLLDRIARRVNAGCEKLPEGGMRDNCEKKVEEGKGKTANLPLTNHDKVFGAGPIEARAFSQDAAGGSQTQPIVRGKTEQDCVDRFRDYQAGLLTRHMIHPNMQVRLFNTKTGVWGKVLQGRTTPLPSFRFNIPVGPIGVADIAKRLRDAGINAIAGTEHVHGIIAAEDEQDAADKLNKAISWRSSFISDRDIGKVIQKYAAKADKKVTGKKLDSLISSTYYKHGDRVQIDMMSIPKIYREAEKAYNEAATHAEGVEAVDKAMVAAIAKYRV